jgi:hypothetical protein
VGYISCICESYFGIELETEIGPPEMSELWRERVDLNHRINQLLTDKSNRYQRRRVKIQLY